jgi:RimJ/RimL family protein N-acetyltransferase
MVRVEYPKTPEENQALAAWVAKRVHFQPAPAGNYCMAIFEEGKGILAVALYQNYRKTDIELVFAAEPKSGWARRDVMSEIISYPFRIGCNRVTAITRKSNRKARKTLQTLGFKHEGKLRRADDDGSDLIIYGLLPDEWRVGHKEKEREAA